jgi:hypothetical protein
MSRDGPDLANSIVIRGAYLYRPVPSFFGDEQAQRARLEVALGQDALRRLDPFCQCALFAVAQAQRMGGLGSESTKEPCSRHGVCVGTAFGAQATRIRYSRRLARHGISATNPIDFPDSIDGAAAAHIAIRWGLGGPSLTFVEGPSSAASALVAACRQIAWGRADRIYCVIGDIYDPWLRSNISGPSPESPSTITSARTLTLNEELVPPDAVLALILERFEVSIHRETQVRVVGFAGDELTRRAEDESSLVRDVTPPEEDPMDFSGVLRVVGAWLQVTAPMGKLSGSCQDVRVDVRRCRIAFEPASRLAFWRRLSSP